MAVSSISCALKPPSPVKEATAPWSGGSLHRACVAAAACAAVAGMAGGSAGDMALARDAAASRADGVVVAVQAQAKGPARWSDRRQCPPWRANTLESIVPENLPRPSPQRRFNGVTAAPALVPDAVAPRSAMGCFSL